VADSPLVIQKPDCTVAIVGRTPPTGNPAPPALLRVRLRIRLRTREAVAVAGLGLGDVPVWVVVDAGSTRFFYRVELDENFGQLSSVRWFEDVVEVPFPVGFRPSTTNIRLTLLHGEWQKGFSGAFGRDVSEGEARTEMVKGSASELWIGQSATFRLPDDTPGADDFYGDPNQTRTDRVVSAINGTLQLAVVAGVTAYAFTRAFK